MAGIFAFSPIEEASTVHTTGTMVLAAGEAPSIVSKVSDTATEAFVGAATVYHWFVFESTTPYTLLDIEVEGTMDAGQGDNADSMSLEVVFTFPGEYASTISGVTLALITDAIGNDICTFCNKEFLTGDDRFDTFTLSYSNLEIEEQFATDPPRGMISFGSNTKIFVQVSQTESGNNNGDMDAIVTFFVAGPDADDIIITVHEKQAQVTTP